jgi:RNA polymerase sigma-70 factor (ECF subfamily)
MPTVPPMDDPGDVPHRDDLLLVQAVLRGDRVARERFLNRMHCARHFVARKNAACGHPLASEELEDCLQDALLALWSKLATYAGRGALESWVYRFCMLEFQGRLRLRGRARRFVELDEEGAADGEQAELDEPEPAGSERLRRALSRLDGPTSELLRLKNCEGLTFDELARRSGESPNTIKTRYYRALERLRVMLGAPARVAEEEHA